MEAVHIMLDVFFTMHVFSCREIELTVENIIVPASINAQKEYNYLQKRYRHSFFINVLF